ncbi:MAG: hypothetical protein ACE15C_18285 [Phycisphaerae bacterium]
MFSIDQNSHSLWDALPKLQALAAAGHAVTHYIEDIDVAFTWLGAHVDGDGLRLARERFHRSGGEDWGAALFYCQFLSRLPVEIRDWEPYTGLSTAALAHQLERTVDDLYDEFSPSDNWQLIGPSYIGDRDHHRTVGDLTTAECAPFVREILAKARADTLGAFPQADCRKRANEWFDDERRRLDSLLEQSPPRLVDLYRLWLSDLLRGTSVKLDETSNLFAIDGERMDLLELFTADYARMAGLYNQALDETRVGLRRLRVERGELPFFAAYTHHGHAVRSPVHLDGRQVVTGDMRFTLDGDGRLPRREMSAAGIRCLAGKAILLVIQARGGPRGQPLALPYRGSMYMPASHRFLAHIRQTAGRLPAIQPVFRVRFRFLDRLRGLDTVICLPPHIRGYFGRTEVPARELGENWQAISDQARRRLESFRDAAFRKRWQEEAFADIASEIATLDARRRELAAVDPKGADFLEKRRVWKDIKLRKTVMLDGLLRQIAADWQARDIDHWDSRGALLPWSVALGGKAFYDDLIANAQIYEERSNDCGL